MAQLNYAQIGDALAAREPFQGNSMWAEYATPDVLPQIGRLPDGAREHLVRDKWDADKQGCSFYVVYSYGTPIAWAWGNHVTIPEERYSVTTSKQQGKARAHLR